MKTKKWKSLRTAASIFCAALMLLSCIGIYAPKTTKAANSTTGTITIKNDSATTHVSISGKTYVAYRVFDLYQNDERTAYDYQVNDNYRAYFKQLAKEYNQGTYTAGGTEGDGVYVKADTTASTKEQTLDSSSNQSILNYVEWKLYGGKEAKSENEVAANIEWFASDLYDWLKVKDKAHETITLTNGSGTAGTAGTADSYEFTADGEEVSITVPLGYYLIYGGGDQMPTNTATGATNDVVAAVILDTPTTTVSVKTSVPTVKKEVRTEDNGSTAVYGDATSASIGDTVHFKVTTCVPDITGYTQYSMIMTDTLSSGLTYDTSSMTVTISYTETVAGNTTKTSATCTPNDGNNTNDKFACTATSNDNSTVGAETTITVNFDNSTTNGDTQGEAYDFYNLIKDGISGIWTKTDSQTQAIPIGATITYEYDAVLNTGAVIGANGNANTAKITYSSDPYTTTATNDTTKSTVEVYTFALDLYKYTGADAASGTALSGAEFELYEASNVTVTDGVASLNSAAKAVAILKEKGTSSAESYPYSSQVSLAEKETTGTTLVSSTEGKIVINGLGEGIYYLKETKAPAGYNRIETLTPVTFNPTYDTTDTKTLTGLTLADGEGTSLIYTTDTDGTYSKDNSNNSGKLAGLHLNIQNNTGSELPSTGGAGRTMIYLIGGLLIAIAVISMTVRKLARKDR